MTRKPLPLALLPLLAFALLPACSSAPGGSGIKDPELMTEEQRKEHEAQQQRDFNAVLIKLDQAMASYVQALARQGDPHADKQVARLGSLLTETVVDERKTIAHAVGDQRELTGHGENYIRLKALAGEGGHAVGSGEAYNQAIALAALGFSGRSEVMPLIAQGAMSDDPLLVDRAVLGLAVLRAPDTQPGILAAVVEDVNHNEEGRVQAAWALHELQSAKSDTTEIVKLWRRFLTTEKDRMPAGVLVQAVRGLGLTADAQHADLVTEYLQHPTPRVRMAAAIALGRMNAQDHWTDLLALLEPSEKSQNVRLHARKSLAALAGNKDYGYDVDAWRKVFDRGQ